MVVVMVLCVYIHVCVHMYMSIFVYVYTVLVTKNTTMKSVSATLTNVAHSLETVNIKGWSIGIHLGRNTYLLCTF